MILNIITILVDLFLYYSLDFSFGHLVSRHFYFPSLIFLYFYSSLFNNIVVIIKDQQSSNLDGNKSIKDKDKDKNLLNDTLPLTLTKSGITGSVSSKTNSMNISSFSVINGNQQSNAQSNVQSNIQSNVQSNAESSVQGNRGRGLTSAGGIGVGVGVGKGGNTNSSSSGVGRLSSSSRSRRISVGSGSTQPMVLSQTGIRQEFWS